MAGSSFPPGPCAESQSLAAALSTEDPCKQIAVIAYAYPESFNHC